MLKKSSNPPVLAFLLSLAMLTVFFVIHACRKLDKQSHVKPDLVREKFFTTSGTTNASVLAIAASIRRQDTKRNFVPSLVKKAGYPRWDKSKVSTRTASARGQSGGAAEQIFIPFVSEEEDQTKAILVVKIDGPDTLYHLQYDTRYSEYGFDPINENGEWRGQQIFAAFAMFDHDILGYTKFKLFDNRVLTGTSDTIGFEPVIITADSTSQPAGRSVTEFTSWITFKVCHVCYARSSNISARDVNTCCNVEYYTVEVTYWFDDEEDEWDWYVPDPSDIPSGGSSCVGCDWSQTNECTPPPPGEPWTQVCDENWQPVPNQVDEVYDVDKFDSVYVDNAIKDSFPCIYKLIKQDMYDVNKVIQKGFDSVFSFQKYEHVRFTLDYSLCGTRTHAYTKNFPTYRVLNGNLNWVDTIALNPCFLNTASREAIVGTIVHEMTHAFINWCFAEYTRNNGFGQVDSNYLKTYFPLHWATFKGDAFNTAIGHDLMVTKYHDYFTRVIYRYSNPAAPVALRQWVASMLAYTGLQKSVAWGKPAGVPASDTCMVHHVAEWASHVRNTPTRPSSVGVDWPDCAITFRNFGDSLQLLPGDSCQ